MKRSNFLKSLLTVIAAPKVLSEVKEVPKEKTKFTPLQWGSADHLKARSKVISVYGNITPTNFNNIKVK